MLFNRGCDVDPQDHSRADISDRVVLQVQTAGQLGGHAQNSRSFCATQFRNHWQYRIPYSFSSGVVSNCKYGGTARVKGSPLNIPPPSAVRERGTRFRRRSLPPNYEKGAALNHRKTLVSAISQIGTRAEPGGQAPNAAPPHLSIDGVRIKTPVHELGAETGNDGKRRAGEQLHDLG